MASNLLAMASNLESGTPAIDTRSQNDCLSNKQPKHVAVRVSLFFCIILTSYFRFILAMFSACFPLYFHFFPRSVQPILLTGKSSHKCRSGTRKQEKTPKQMQTPSKLCCFCIFFRTTYLMVGHVWLPLLNTTLTH